VIAGPRVIAGTPASAEPSGCRRPKLGSLRSRRSTAVDFSFVHFSLLSTGDPQFLQATMRLPNFVLPVLASALQATAVPLSPRAGVEQYVIDHANVDVAFGCDLPKPVSPDADGLPTAEDVFSDETALHRQVERHSAIVRVPSVSYDDGGDVYQDKRWLVFFELHRVLRDLFPTV